MARVASISVPSPAAAPTAAATPARPWRTAVQVGLVISIVAIVMSLMLQAVVPTTPLVLGVMVVGFVASWIMTGRTATTRDAR